MFMTRGQYWFVVSAVFVAVFGFPLLVGLAPGAASVCADRVQAFDGARSSWRWTPTGVECHITLRNGEEARFVLPWQQPKPRRLISGTL